jgi:hypothetical protein
MPFRAHRTPGWAPVLRHETGYFIPLSSPALDGSVPWMRRRRTHSSSGRHGRWTVRPFVKGQLHQEDLERLAEGIQRDGGQPVGVETWAFHRTTGSPSPSHRPSARPGSWRGG